MKIYNEDCMKTMNAMSDKSVKLILTDPPYLMNYKSSQRKESFDSIKNDIGAEDLISNYFSECNRILKDNSHIYSFCSWHRIDFFKQEFEKHFTLKNIIVWHKPGGGMGDLKGSFMPNHEFLLFGHKGRKELQGKRLPDVFTVKKIPGSKMVHPTEKPVPELKTLIECSSSEGDVVFDGFMGSGAVGVAAIETGRKFVGCELDKRYFEIAKSRIESSSKTPVETNVILDLI